MANCVSVMIKMLSLFNITISCHGRGCVCGGLRQLYDMMVGESPVRPHKGLLTKLQAAVHGSSESSSNWKISMPGKPNAFPMFEALSIITADILSSSSNVSMMCLYS